MFESTSQALNKPHNIWNEHELKKFAHPRVCLKASFFDACLLKPWMDLQGYN
jgi:hypothetical protein